MPHRPTRTPLVAAASAKKLQRARTILHGIQTDLDTALCSAVLPGNEAVVALLIKAGADIGTLNYLLLREAIQAGLVPIVELLMPTQLQLSTLPFSPLLVATTHTQAAVVKSLLSRNPPLGFDLVTPIRVAATQLSMHSEEITADSRAAVVDCLDSLLKFAATQPLSDESIKTIADLVSRLSRTRAATFVAASLAQNQPPLHRHSD